METEKQNTTLGGILPNTTSNGRSTACLVLTFFKAGSEISTEISLVSSNTILLSPSNENREMEINKSL